MPTRSYYRPRCRNFPRSMPRWRCLGPDHRFATTLYRRGSDIYLKGGGDPSLAGARSSGPGSAAPSSAPGGCEHRQRGRQILLRRQPDGEPAEITAHQPVAVAYNTGISALNIRFQSRRGGLAAEAQWAFQFSRALHGRSGHDPAGGLDDHLFRPASPEVSADTPFLYARDSTLDRWQYARTLADHGSTFLPVKATATHTALLFRTLPQAGGVALPLPKPGQVPAERCRSAGIASRPFAESSSDCCASATIPRPSSSASPPRASRPTNSRPPGAIGRGPRRD